MKNIIISISLLVLVLTLSSCEESANITIQNNVHNASLERVGWDGYTIANYLIPGEKKKYTVSDIKSNFPKNSVVKFYMRRDNNRVYLETKHTFTLDIDDNLVIVISDTTQVRNPLLQEVE